MDSDGTLALEKSHDMSHGIFGWDGDKEMQMIWSSSAFEDLAFFLGCQLTDHLADLGSHLAEKDFLAIFWYNDHVILAVPYHVTLCFK